jgi:hypothetical protein
LLCSYIVVWIALSATVILINKYVLAFAGFPYPVALTLVHMAFCSSLAFLLIKLGVSETVHMDSGMYIKWVTMGAMRPAWAVLARVHAAHVLALAGRAAWCANSGHTNNPTHMHIPSCPRACRNVLPIAALFSGTLWMGNAAYLYLSVAFIQMLKVGTRPGSLLLGLSLIWK